MNGLYLRRPETLLKKVKCFYIDPSDCVKEAYMIQLAMHCTNIQMNS